MDNYVLTVLLLTAVAVLTASLLVYRQRELARRRRLAEEAMRMREVKPTPLPEGTVFVSTEGASQDLRQSLVGAFMLVAIGTFGLNQLNRLLSLLHLCGLEQMVGSAVVIENDAQLREYFHLHIPACYHDRVVYGYAEAFSGGMANKSIDWVLDHVDKWGGPLQAAADTVIDRHLRRNRSRSPGSICVFESLGGQGPTGLPVLARIYDRFEEALIVGFTALPRHERLRERFAQLKRKYEEHGVFGWVLTDNLGPDPVTADTGMVAMIEALADAALHADQGTQPNNSFSLTLTEQPGAILILQVAASNVVAYPFTAEPTRPRYYVYEQPVVEEILKGLRKIERGEGVWSADLPVGENGTAVFDMILASLHHDDLRRVEDRVTSGRKLRDSILLSSRADGVDLPSLVSQPNYETAFASMATIIDANQPVCPLIVVRLIAVRDGASIVKEIVKVPQRRRLAKPGAERTTTNGKKEMPVERATENT